MGLLSRAHCPPQKLQAILPQGRIRLSRKGKVEARKDLDGIRESLTRLCHGEKDASSSNALEMLAKGMQRCSGKEMHAACVRRGRRSNVLLRLMHGISFGADGTIT